MCYISPAFSATFSPSHSHYGAAINPISTVIRLAATNSTACPVPVWFPAAFSQWKVSPYLHLILMVPVAESALGKTGLLNKIQLRNHQVNRNTSVSRKVWEVKSDERSILSIAEYEGATTWSSLNASFDRTLQSFLATLPLLIPSIQPHHYGNYWMSQPSSLTCAMQPCLRGCAVKCLLITVPGHTHPHAVT